MSGDVLPTIVGILLVATAAAFALVPFARGVRADSSGPEAPATDRFSLYGQVLELEFDYQLGKLSAEDYGRLSAELLAEAGQALREERGTVGAVEDEIEREIAAARAALATARRTPEPVSDGRSGRRSRASKRARGSSKAAGRPS